MANSIKAARMTPSGLTKPVARPDSEKSKASSTELGRLTTSQAKHHVKLAKKRKERRSEISRHVVQSGADCEIQGGCQSYKDRATVQVSDG